MAPLLYNILYLKRPYFLTSGKLCLKLIFSKKEKQQQQNKQTKRNANNRKIIVQTLLR